MFKIVSSSAGSGKTYTLAKEYLKLALGNPNSSQADDYFKTILAVTFTNAAANEMKTRILDALARIAQGTATDDDPLFAQLTEELTGHAPDTDAFGVAQTQLRQRAQQVFHTILHRYADFSVTTIDSFTQRVVQAFSDELGLPFSFEVEMDTDSVMELAIDQLIEKAGGEELEEITTILTELYHQTATDGESWHSLPRQLREFGKDLTSDRFHASVAAIQELSPKAIRQIRKQVAAAIHDTETQLRNWATRALEIMGDAGLSGDDFRGKKNSIFYFFETVAESDPYKEPTQTHKTSIEGDWYTKQTPTPVQAAIDKIAPQLAEAFEQIMAIRAQQGPLVQLYKQLLPHLQKMALLRQMRVEFDELLRKDGRVHISEFNRKILQVVANEPIPFVYERLGNRYNHILIDEFQDTSRLQFANLMPLIDNALGNGHQNLVVGDGKQAIYRFRGGDMDQIVALQTQNLPALQALHGVETFTAERIETLRSHMQPDYLTTNWRSSEPVIQFNNAFFEFAARRYETLPTAGRLADVYDAERKFQQQTSPRTNPNGLVQVDFLAKDDDTDLTAKMIGRTVALLQECLADGYTYGDMAVLCRTREQARQTANALNALHIPLVSADSLSLEFSEPVRWIVTLMQLLQRPDLPLLRYELLYLYHQAIRRQFPDEHLTTRLRSIALAGSEAVFDYLNEEGYALDSAVLRQLNPYELAERLMATFQLFAQAEHVPFLFRFLDEIMTFNQRESGHLSDFLQYWQSAQQKVSVQGSSQQAVSIQTIHKAKGLEFPVVMVPFANWDMGIRPDSTLWFDLSGLDADALQYQATPAEPPERLRTARTNAVKALENSPDVVADQFHDELQRTFVEKTNLLYVAFTRAIDRLYVLSEREKDPSRDSHRKVSRWLYDFLDKSSYAQACGCGWQEGCSTYRFGDGGSSRSHRQTQTSGQRITLSEVISGTRGQNLQLRRQAERVFDVETFEKTRERERKLGVALSQIRGLGDVEPTLRRLVGEGVLRPAEVPDLRVGVLRVIQHPDLSRFFDDSLRIDTDRSILSRRRLHGAPHRVVHLPDGRVVLIQYAPAGREVDGSSVDTLHLFIGLYRQMGFQSVEGRLVTLAEIPDVIPIQA